MESILQIGLIILAQALVVFGYFYGEPKKINNELLPDVFNGITKGMVANVN